MPGINLFSEFEMFKHLALQDSSAASDLAIKDRTFVKFINEGYRWLTEETMMDIGRQATVDLVAGTSEYSLPTDRMGWDIEEIRLTDSSGNDSGALNRRVHSYMRDKYDLGTETNGTPEDWAISRTDPTKFVIMPPPDYTASNSVLIYYTKLSRVHRLYKPSSITITITNGTSAGTLSSSGWDAGRLAVGDELAVMPTSQYDADSMLGTSDAEFITIATLSGTAVTFAETYVGPTATALGFVSGQVHPINKTFPGKFGFAACYWACYMYLMGRENVERAGIYKSMALEAISNKGRGDSFIKDTPPDPRSHFAWLR